MNYETLKERHREVRDQYPPNLNLRVHRALSWLQRADMADDLDGRFIFLWIAFNAAYAYEIDVSHRLSEQSTFRGFLEKLCVLDKDGRIDALVWQEFSGSIRILLDTPYVFQSFWDWQCGRISKEDWEQRFERGKQKANHALGSGDTAVLLGLIFNRLYTLRNQLVHGGATWNSAVNRKQLRDCTDLLGKLVPLMIALMLDNPDTLWGDACYPVVTEA
ncbi:MAG TPA: HEPN domain-containing protein [Burkholderiaceae bacterium]|nr:hypothetical protein [bacterium SGD-2]HZH56759.1 HEPN domain-containing protein [Burkholderiaceae bacterium]